MPAQIRDVSARGICFYLDSAVAQGSPIGFTLTLPPEITLTESIRVQCKGRVVRVENGRPDGKLAVAAVIEEYEFLPEAESRDSTRRQKLRRQHQDLLPAHRCRTSDSPRLLVPDSPCRVTSLASTASDMFPSSLQ